MRCIENGLGYVDGSEGANRNGKKGDDVRSQGHHQ